MNSRLWNRSQLRWLCLTAVKSAPMRTCEKTCDGITWQELWLDAPVSSAPDLHPCPFIDFAFASIRVSQRIQLVQTQLAFNTLTDV